MSSTDRLFRILEMLVGEPGGARVTDLANELDLNRAIPHRLLAEMVELGYVAQDPVTERYRATFMLGSLGLRQLETAGVPKWAQDELRSLAAMSRELVRLAAASGDRLRFIAQAQGAHSALIIDSPMRGDISLHATATGKAWLATLEEAEIEDVLQRRGLEAYTDKTHTDLSQVLSEVRRAANEGFAVTHEEMEAGISAIAAPIIPPTIAGRRAVGTISIAGPSVRLTQDVLVSFGPEIMATADKLAAQWHIFEYLDALTTPPDAHPSST